MHHARSKFLLIALGILSVAVGCERDPLPTTPGPAPAPAVRNPPLHVRVTGRDYRWHLRYPGPDGRLDTPDDVLTERHLHLPTETDVQLELRSDDFAYTVYLPEYELVEMAFPGRPFTLELATASATTSGFLGTQMCGFTHEQLLGDLVVHTPDDFRGWLRRTAGP